MEPDAHASSSRYPFAHVDVVYDHQGRLVEPIAAETVAKDLKRIDPTDIFVFAHGWRNSRVDAAQKYSAYFGLMADVLKRYEITPTPDKRLATIGVYWPARDLVNRRWAARGVGPAASVSEGALVEVESDLSSFSLAEPDRQRAADDLGRLVGVLSETPTMAELIGIQALMRVIVGERDGDHDADDRGELLVLDGDATDVFKSLGQQAIEARALDPDPSEDPGASFVGGVGTILRAGVRVGLENVSFWLNKDRSGIVGERGLAPLLRTLATQLPGTRFHLIGHSFGARLVSFALRGLASEAAPPPTVGSVMLLQGAFSHLGFSPTIGEEDPKKGGLAGAESVVKGPLIATFSSWDRALSGLYPLAVLASGEVAAGLPDRVANFVAEGLPRHGAIGRWGFQGVDAVYCKVARPRKRSILRFWLNPSVTFRAGMFVNINGEHLIQNRDNPPQDAHGDIIHPELAWLTLLAAGIIEAPSP